MDEQINSISKALVALEDIESSLSLSNPTQPQPSGMLSKLNVLNDSLMSIYMSGNSSYLEIPTDLLRYLDEESSNPWLYMHEQLSSCESAARHLSERNQALEKIKTETLNAVRKDIESSDVAEAK